MDKQEEKIQEEIERGKTERTGRKGKSSSGSEETDQRCYY